jgi:hypothetical protein
VTGEQQARCIPERMTGRQRLFVKGARTGYWRLAIAALVISFVATRVPWTDRVQASGAEEWVEGELIGTWRSEAVSFRMDEGQVTFYCGYDPSNTSLTAGNLVAIMLQSFLQRAGHRPLVVLGGGGWAFLAAGSTVWAGPDRWQAQWSGSVVAVIATLISVRWTLRLTSDERRTAIRKRVERALDDAQRCYLRGRMARARIALDSGLTQDERDIDLLFLDWQVARQLGDSSRARRSRRLLRRYDLDEKWLWELQREEATRGG